MTLRNGRTALPDGGAGIFLDHAALTLRDSTVSNCAGYSTRGAGICTIGSALTLLNTTVQANQTFGPPGYRTSGGGIYALTSTVELRDTDILSNTAWYSPGGGIFCSGSPLVATACDISNNRAHSNGYPVPLAYAGGVSSTDVVTLSGCSIQSNGVDGIKAARAILTDCLVAGHLGKGVDGQTLTLTNTTVSGNGYGGVFGSDIRLYGSQIVGNTRMFSTLDNYQSGGGISGISVRVVDSVVYGNDLGFTTYRAYQPVGRGGGVFATTLLLQNSIVAGNTVPTPVSVSAPGESAGGGIYATNVHVVNSLIANNSVGSLSGRLSHGSALAASSVVIEHSTITGNRVLGTSPTSSCLHITAGGSIENSIIWGNPSSGAPIDGNPTVSFSDINGGFAGQGNIDQDPLFIDPMNQDYRIRSNSACIDTGRAGFLPSGLDLSGCPRAQDGDLDGMLRIDIGAFEYDNLHLEVTGSPTPGGTLSFNATTSVGGLLAIRVIGTAPGEVPFVPFGSIFVDLMSPVFLQDIGIPGRTQVPIPIGTPTPLPLFVQDIAVTPSASAGNTSNPVALVID
ncbi:MAG: right-handed parallel beta-helix repeat-containing protein [Planctomycetes bacterium]|nr:right-handed parallel beta-helix repeat-containing protein [Planctomycetota bacterium]